MTDQFETNIKQAFEAECGAYDRDVPESEREDPPIEALVAAILSDKHTLSAEDLAVFDGVLNDPEIDPEQRQELLQTVWNIVVCIIDYQWENTGGFVPPSNGTESCESNSHRAEDIDQAVQNMIECWDDTQSQTDREVVDRSPSKEGGP